MVQWIHFFLAVDRGKGRYASKNALPLLHEVLCVHVPGALEKGPSCDC
jgi:hypothetical protein